MTERCCLDTYFALLTHSVLYCLFLLNAVRRKSNIQMLHYLLTMDVILLDEVGQLSGKP